VDRSAEIARREVLVTYLAREAHRSGFVVPDRALFCQFVAHQALDSSTEDLRAIVHRGVLQAPEDFILHAAAHAELYRREHPEEHEPDLRD